MNMMDQRRADSIEIDLVMFRRHNDVTWASWYPKSLAVVESCHKGSTMRGVFPNHAVIMTFFGDHQNILWSNTFSSKIDTSLSGPRWWLLRRRWLQQSYHQWQHIKKYILHMLSNIDPSGRFEDNMMTSSNGIFFALLPIWSPVNSPRKGQWRGALMFSLICVWINGWVNNREAGDLRRYRAHYDVTLMNRDRFASAKRWVGNKLSSYPKMIAPVCFEYTDSIFIYGCTKTTHVTCQVPCLNL